MSIFKPVTLKWKGKEYTIPANEVLPVLADIETKMTFGELQQAAAVPEKAPLGTMSQVFGIALRAAGCKVSDEEVYFSIFHTDDAKADVGMVSVTIMQMMIPPGSESEKLMKAAQAAAMAEIEDEAEVEGNEVLPGLPGGKSLETVDS